MSVITISRQVAALGDEIASDAAKELGYTFVTRHDIEKRIVELGIQKEKLEKYDERKPGFFASLSKNRDEYLNYLQLAVIEAASKGNCILIGRGAFAILEDVPGMIPIRLIAKDSIRIERLKKEFNWTEKQAMQRIEESRNNRAGFHKDFFNINHDDAQNYLMTLNTGILSREECVKIIVQTAKSISTEHNECGEKILSQMLSCQELTNKLLYEYHMKIDFLRAVSNTEGTEITLHGITDSQATIEKAVNLAAKILPSFSIKSAICVTQDFKSFN